MIPTVLCAYSLTELVLGSMSAIEPQFYDEEAGEYLKPILDCRKQLLEAGCDPTLPLVAAGQIHGTHFGYVLESAVPVRDSYILPSPFYARLPCRFIGISVTDSRVTNTYRKPSEFCSTPVHVL